jgi:hypothetical protein
LVNFCLFWESYFTGLGQKFLSGDNFPKTAKESDKSEKSGLTNYDPKCHWQKKPLVAAMKNSR